ncbi:MAG TPA: nitronate monooxygenase [Candidatus Omnitrophota bacterium]|nr:nitronate monooxygenase [Candidatus Omnitrophota bacterium]
MTELERSRNSMLNGLKKLRIGDLTAKLPIIQGGMGVGISMSGLASAVAEEGGVGVIATAGIGMLESDGFSNFLEASIRGLRREIRKTREKTKGIVGVNIMVALSNFGDMVRTAVEEKADIIFSGAGLPLRLPEFLKEKGRTKLIPIVSSAKAANLLIRKWLGKYDYLPDAFVVEGPLAGGHLGFKPEQIEDANYSLDRLVPEVVAEVRPYEEKHQKEIPVIAAGGIYTGEDIRRIMDQGASGVQLATRFVCTDECDAAPEFKNAFLKSRKEDLVIIKSPVGMPGRAIRNQYIDDVNAGKKKPFRCPLHCIVTCERQSSPYCIALALTNALKGRLDRGFAFAGANAYRTDRIISVKALLAELLSEFRSSDK